MSNVRMISLRLVAAALLVAFVAGCGHPKKRGRENWTPGDTEIAEIDDLGGIGYAPGDMEIDPDGAMLAERPMEGDFATEEGMFENVLFDFDSAVIRPSQMGALDYVADYMRQSPEEYLLVEGHCDERGSREYNLALGERRAQAARTYLLDSGIDPARIQTRSMGEEDPLDPGHDETAWTQNRRAEFLLIR